MHRFFLSPECFQGDEVIFAAQTARQMQRVLRLQPGEKVAALDGRGSESLVQLSALAADGCRGRVLETYPSTGEPRRRICLLLCLTQREKFEWMLQKCTEAGAAEFVPVISARSLSHKAEEAEAKRPRWEGILREAAEQSGRGLVPVLQSARTLRQALKSASGDLKIILWEEESSRGLRTVFSSAAWTSAAILVGPEGGLSAEEVDSARQAGFVSASLGKRILRMETAALAAVILAMYEAGEMG